MSSEVSTTVTENEIMQHSGSSNDILLDGVLYQQVQAFAKMMATGKATVPQHLKDSDADCMAVTLQSLQWGMNPFAVAQKTHLVNGTLGYEAQLVNAVVSTSRAIEGRFHYRYSEGKWSGHDDPKAWVQVGAVLKGETEITWGEPVYPAEQQVKNSPLWKTDPKQQTAYLALKKWARLYTPGVILGVYTPDELQEINPTSNIREINPQASALSGAEPKSAALADQSEEDPCALDDVLQSFRSAQTMADIKAAAESAASLPDSQQAKAREAYKARAGEIKKSGQTSDKKEANHSEAYASLSRGIEMAASHGDLDALVNLPQWADLMKGEAQQLQKLVTQAREALDASTEVEGLFEQ